MSNVAIMFRPLTQWPAGRSSARRRSQFKCSYDRAMRKLREEMSRISVYRVVLMVDLNESDIRMDGLPRGDRQPRSSRVAVAYTRDKRDFIIRADQYGEWTHNLYAIGMTLEALRAVDRWGVTSGGEQYLGFAALPAGEFGSVDDAAALLVTVGGGNTDDVIASSDNLTKAYRRAAMVAHPDRPNGNAQQFERVTRAMQFIAQAKGWRL